LGRIQEVQKGALGVVSKEGKGCKVVDTQKEKTFHHRSFQDIPEPQSLPLIGHLHLLSTKQSDKLHSHLKAKLGPIYKTRVLGESMVWLHCPGDIRTLLRKESAMPILPSMNTFIELRREEDYKHIFHESTGLISQGETWYKFRQAVQKDMMCPSGTLRYIKKIEDIALDLTEVMQEKRDEDDRTEVGALCHQFALESIATIFYGARFRVLRGEQDGRNMIESMNHIMQEGLKMIFLPLWACKMCPGWSNTKKHYNRMMEINYRRVTGAMAELDLEDESDKSVLARLVRKCGKDSMVPVIMAMDSLAAGSDTTGNTCAFLLYHLAANPEKQNHLYKELKSALGKDGRLTSKILPKLPYLRACQMESQRLLPVTFGIGRQTETDMVLGGYQVPRRTKVVSAGMVISNDADHFDQPDQFVPEQWMRGNSLYNNADPFAFLPFGRGPRSCIGQRFAKLEVLVMAAKVVQRYELGYAGKPIGLSTGILNSPDREVRIQLRERR